LINTAGVGPSWGVLASGAGTITIDGSAIVDSGVLIIGDRTMTIDDTADELTITFFERIDGQRVRARLEPESDLRPIEQLRISNLITALTSRGSNLKPVAYIRRYNLERHFRFIQE